VNEEDDGYGQDESPVRQYTTLQLQSSKRKPVIVELTSSLPASGKTNFLYSVTARAVLSSEHGGQGTAVVWFDTDGRFSATRLREVVLGVVSSSDSDEQDRESLVQEALMHVHVFRPQSSRQLIETLDCLSPYLLDATAHSSIRRRLGLLVLDSATAFYWQDRFEAEAARFEHPEKPRDKPSRTVEVVTRLKKMQKEFDCAVMFSTSAHCTTAGRHAPIVGSENAAPQEPRSISPWATFANLTLNMSRVDVPRFAAHMSLQACLRDREKRQEAVVKGSFAAEVDRSGSEMWTAGLKEKWRQLDPGGSFEFSISTSVTLW